MSETNDYPLHETLAQALRRHGISYHRDSVTEHDGAYTLNDSTGALLGRFDVWAGWELVHKLDSPK